MLRDAEAGVSIEEDSLDLRVWEGEKLPETEIITITLAPRGALPRARGYSPRIASRIALTSGEEISLDMWKVCLGGVSGTQQSHAHHAHRTAVLF